MFLLCHAELDSASTWDSEINSEWHNKTIHHKTVTEVTMLEDVSKEIETLKERLGTLRGYLWNWQQRN